MASPMVEGRLDPHKKPHFTLHISDQIADGEVGDYTSVKYNHKPVQPTSSRTTTLTSTSANTYALTLEDKKEGDKKDVFVFTGQKTTPKKSYILLFDTNSHKATLEPLASTYTFNVATKNGADISSTYSKIYPRKQKDDAHDTAAGADDLFDENAHDDLDADPDTSNPYDFRHFLSKEKAKRGDESEYNTSSPDYRTGTSSALNTPQFTARKPAAAVTSKPKAPAQAAPKPKKRKSPEPERKRAAPKKQAPPAVRLERRATQQKPEPAKPARKAAGAPPASKIKSAEIIHSDDELDSDAEGEADDSTFPSHAHRSPSPIQHRHASPESDEDEEMDDVGGASNLDIEIEVPDAQPSKPSRPSALSSLGLGYVKSPSAGPISLASAAHSVEGSPNPHGLANRNNQDDDGVIDFGDLGGGGGSDEDADADEDDVDVEPMDIGPPAQSRASGVPGDEGEAEGEEEDPLVQAMMMGLAGGESSEESEEE